MAFTPILTDKTLDYVENNRYYKNANRENAWGSPVYFVPYNRDIDGDYSNGFGGPHYQQYFNYNNSPETAKGNCTWWCCGRLQETLGKNVVTLMNQASPNGNGWYNAFTGTRYLTANNAVPGDIICFSGGDFGHVMFIEQVQNGVLYVSQSAWSYRDYWTGYACRVNTYNVSDIYNGNSIDMYKGTGNPYYMTVIGVIHTGEDSPSPGTETPTITITPSSYSKTIATGENYADFQFSIRIEGIPSGYTVSGGNTYPGLDRVYNTGWSYTDYTVDGVTYRRATKTQTLRYYRESDSAYVTNKYMYFNLSFPNGNINSSTLMTITVEQNKKGLLMLEWYGGGIQIL